LTTQIASDQTVLDLLYPLLCDSWNSQWYMWLFFKCIYRCSYL